MHPGQCFKALRKAKGLSQKAAAAGLVSPSLLSKFENGLSDIGLANFLALLDANQISLTEFDWSLQHVDHSHFQFLLSEIERIQAAKEAKRFAPLLSEEERLYQKHHNKFYHLNAIMIKVIMHESGCQIAPSDQEVADLIDYFFGVESWAMYEVILFHHTLDTLPLPSQELIAKELVKKIDLPASLPDLDVLYLYPILKVMKNLLLKKQLPSFDSLMQAIRPVCIPEHCLWEKITLLCLDLAYEVAHSPKDPELLERKGKILDILRFLDSSLAEKIAPLFPNDSL